MQGSKRVLIVSHGPFPTPEQTRVEGGGLRCWGLARGLKDNNPGLHVTVVHHESYSRPNPTTESEGIRIATWNHETIAAMAREFDSVVVSYCMGEAAVRLIRGLQSHQQLILDCYVPIFVEVPARESSDLLREQAGYLREFPTWTEPLRRGDFFLVASAEQERFYRGVLSAMGRINPLTYGRSMLLQVPYGIDRGDPVAEDRPISRLVGDPSVKKVLWFGGMYPWFDARGLVDAMARVNEKRPARLVIVGARNPFNEQPDLLARYHEFVDYVNRPEYKGLVILQDWVDYRRRGDWYLDADLIVTVNRPGEENALSWRTRLVDFAWAGVPVATNGGDPLGEALIASGAAARFDGLEPAEIAATIGRLLGDDATTSAIRGNLARFKRRLYWDVVTAPMARVIESGERAPDLLLDLSTAPTSTAASPGRIGKVVRLARKVPAYLRKHGPRATAAMARQYLARRLRIDASGAPGRRPAIVAMAHRLDCSGAPFVLVDALAEMVDRGLSSQIRLFSHPPVHGSNLDRLAGLGLTTTLLPDPDAVPSFVPGDVVLMNTTGFSHASRSAVLNALDRGIVKKMFWYVHEDAPGRIFDPTETAAIRRRINEGKLEIVTLSRQARENYRAHFGTEIGIEPHRVDLPERYRCVRDPSDFEKIRFILPGTFLDGRKGQHAILYALSAFHRHHFEPDRESYREFTLSFVGIEDDWYSRQVVRHQRILGDRLILHPKVSREESLEFIREANVTICYSQSETLPVFVVEGMLAGHPILRNDCSGVEEQLEPGRNGFLLDTEDFWQVVGTFERLLNRWKTSDDCLAEMSARSHAIAMKQRANRYETLIDGLRSALLGDPTPPPRPHLLRDRSEARPRFQVRS